MYKVLSLTVVEKFVSMMERKHVSEVARSPRGFLPAYRAAGGDLRKMSPAWQAKREGFVARHLAQARTAGESLFDYRGFPSRRHLALIAWAYTPNSERITTLSRRFTR